MKHLDHDKMKSHLKVSIMDIAAEMENDRQESVVKLAQAMVCLQKQFTPLFIRIQQLSKKTARWVTNMLYEETKKEQLRMCKAVMTMIAVAS